MAKKKKFLIIVFFVLMMVLGYFFVTSQNKVSQSIISEQTRSFDNKVFNDQLLDLTYYENPRYAGFSSYLLENERQIDLLDVLNALRISQYIQGQSDDYDRDVGFIGEKARDVLKNYTFQDNLMNLIYMIEIEYILGLDYENEMKELKAFYCISTGLFNYSEEDSLFQQLVYTYKVIDLSKKMGGTVDFVDEAIIINTIDQIDLSSADINQSLFDNRGMMILLADLIGYDSFLSNYNHVLWFEQMVSLPLELNQLLDFLYVCEINQLASVLDIDDYQQTITDYVATIDSFDKIYESETAMVLNTVYLEKIALLTTNKNLYSETIDYLVYLSKTDFKKNTLVDLNISDTFYGLQLAKNQDYQIDQDKIINYVEENYNFESIQNINELIDLYYYSLLDYNYDDISLKALDYKGLVNDFISGYEIGQSVSTDLKVMNYCLEILAIEEQSLTINNANKLKSYYDELYQTDIYDTILHSSYIYELYNIGRMLDYNIVTESLIQEKSQDIYLNGGFSIVMDDQAISDLFTTYKMLVLLGDDFIEENHIDIHQWLMGLIDNNITYVSNERAYTNLRANYYCNDILERLYQYI